MTDGQLILVAGLLMAAGLGAAKVADRVRVPGLLLFLGLGMLVGSEGIGGVEFNDAELTRTLGTIGLVLILFEGGLTAGWQEIRPVLGSAVSLASIGTVADGRDRRRLRDVGLRRRPSGRAHHRLGRSRRRTPRRSSPSFADRASGGAWREPSRASRA